MEDEEWDDIPSREKMLKEADKEFHLNDEIGECIFQNQIKI